MNTEKLLHALEGVRATGDRQWYARCPAHDDKTPSLKITETADRLLIYCHAGCATQEVLDAARLTWTDLYPDKWDAAYKAGTSNRGEAFRKHLEQEVDPLDVERMVLRIAAGRLERGESLTVEDEARVELARARLSEAREEAA